MILFSLTHNLHNSEGHAIFHDIMEAWEAQQVMESTWILKRNDDCTCQDIIDDLMEHIDADNEVFVVEVGQKNGKFQMEHYVPSRQV